MHRNGSLQKKNSNLFENIIGQLSLSDVGCAAYMSTFHEVAKNNSIIALAGENFAIMAIDVNDDAKPEQAFHRVSQRVVLASTGCQCKTSNLASLLRARMYMNECLRKKVMKPHCLAQLFSCILTNVHFGVCEASYVMAGLDKNGKGVVYAYDLLGYHEKTPYRALGTAKIYLQMYLNKVMRCFQNEYDDSSLDVEPFLYYDEALELVIKAFKSAATCKGVHTGNKLLIASITKCGVCTQEVDL